MEDPSLLGDLCTICHSTPKYRCPRCSARTCSLVCSKRHKQWAQCSGTRDPAAYLKRSELATPKSFDRDFNFISGIERKLERADRDATSRGVQLHAAAQAGKRDGPAKGEVPLQRAMERCGVVIEKAPIGMQRHLNNRTSWNKNQHCIAWTIEWVLDDGHAELGTSLEKDALSESFRKHLDRQCPPTKKRKLSKGGHRPDVSASKTSMVLQHDAGGAAGSASSPNEQGHLTTETVDLEATISPSVDPMSELHRSPRPHQNVRSEDCQEEAAAILPSQTAAAPRHFYLHIPHPSIPSAKPTLLPLSPLSILSSVLGSRIVREFPTIYVLTHEQDDLPPERFVLQRDVAAEPGVGLEGMLEAEEDDSRDTSKNRKEFRGNGLPLADVAQNDPGNVVVSGESVGGERSRDDDLRYIQESIIG